MFDLNGQPLKIVVETVPHEVVNRLDTTDKHLQDQINATRNILNETIALIRDLKKELRDLKSR